MPAKILPLASGLASPRGIEVNIKPIEKYFKLAYFILAAILLIFSVSKAGAVGDLSPIRVLLNLSVSMAVLACATIVGLFFGFLFGIPRSVQKPSETAAAIDGGAVAAGTGAATLSRGKRARSYITNTNLEEISDWLTKIIIGLSLTQFREIISLLETSAKSVSAYLAGKPAPVTYDGVSSMPFFMALIIFGLLAGFLFCYLQTRVRLTLLFISAENAFMNESDIAASSAASIAAAEDNDGSRSIRPNPPIAADERLARVSRSDITDTKELVAWASAQARMKNLVVAEDALRDALQRDPTNTDIYLKIADVRQLRKNFAGALDIIREGASKATNEAARIHFLHRAILNALYVPAPAGFRQALELYDTLVKQVALPEPMVNVWRAAAFGQQFKWERDNGASPEQLAQTREQALDSIRKVVAAVPRAEATERMFLRSMLNPSEAEASAGEDDLSVFAGDPEFVSLIK